MIDEKLTKLQDIVSALQEREKFWKEGFLDKWNNDFKKLIIDRDKSYVDRIEKLEEYNRKER